MPGITTMMDISRWALNTSSLQLNTVSHNVANANTVGYSRQSVVTGTMFAEKTSSGYYGLGVTAQTVIQHVDKLILKRVTDKQSELSYQDTFMSQLLRLQSLSNEAGDASLGTLTTAFFNAWQNVSNNPESSAVREDLLETAQTLTSRLQDLNNDLRLMRNDLDSYLKQAVTDVNDIARKIASLNKQIVSGEFSGHTANDLRDERINLLNELSTKMDIQWFEDDYGAITVTIGNGKTIVHNDYPRPTDTDPLVWDYVAGTNEKKISWQGTVVTIESQEVTGGTIGAWLKVRDVEIPQSVEFFNTFTKTLIGAVNIVHSNGAGLEKFSTVGGSYTTTDPSLRFDDPGQDLAFADMVQNGQVSFWVYQNGMQHQYTVEVYAHDSMQTVTERMNRVMHAATWPTIDTSQAPQAYWSKTENNSYHFYMASTPNSGIEFAFAGDSSGLLAALGVNTFFTGDSVTNIGIHNDIKNDVSCIAAGRILATGEHAKGDNSNALILANLKDTQLMGNGRQTLNESVIQWAAQLGTKIASSQDKYSFAYTTLAQLEAQRDNISAVNTDEELILLIQFQRAYQAAAKMVNVADTLLEEIINLKR